jgi:hypothetical protein
MIICTTKFEHIDQDAGMMHHRDASTLCWLIRLTINSYGPESRHYVHLTCAFQVRPDLERP